MPEDPEGQNTTLHPDEEQTLRNELRGNEKIVGSMNQCARTCQDFVSRFVEEHPDKKYLLARIGNSRTESGYRQIELRIQANGSLSVEVTAADLDQNGRDFSRTISFSYHKDGEGERGLENISVGSKIGAPKGSITVQRGSDGEILSTTGSFGSNIPATELSSAAQEVSNIIATLSDPEIQKDEFKIEPEPPPSYTLGSGHVENHPKATLN